MKSVVSRMVGAIAPVAAFASCIDPSYGAGGFRCPSGVCPEGYVCVLEAADRVCRLPGSSADAMPADQRRPTNAEARVDRPSREDRAVVDSMIDRRVDVRRPDFPNRLDSGPEACLPQPFFKDGDGDGYGDPVSKVMVCAQPAGYVARASDCDDGDAEAHPGQMAFSAQPSQGTTSFDFNCDMVEEKEHPLAVNCAPSGAGCTGDGWSGVVPACGQSGSYAKCFKQSGMSGCSQSVSGLVQRCR